MLRILLPLCLQYLDEFIQSESLSRRLAHLCCKKLGQLALRGGTFVKEEPNSNVNAQVTPGSSILLGASNANSTINNINTARSGSTSNVPVTNNSNGNNTNATSSNSSSLQTSSNNISNSSNSAQQNIVTANVNSSTNGNNANTGNTNNGNSNNGTQ